MIDVPLRYFDAREPTLEQVWPTEWVQHWRTFKPAPWSPKFMRAGLMVIYGGFFWESERVRQVQDLGGGCGAITCGDCQGTGLFDVPNKTITCPACKGSGRAYVMI
jgi:hypothetical protein